MAQLNKIYNQRSILYLNDGVGVFAGNGDPNGVEKGEVGSIYSDLDTGNVYAKTTAFNTLTGWIVFGGGGGSGTVTSFSSGNLSPLFTSSVANPTTTPALSFAQISQLQNLVFASPNGSVGNPTFRALVASDLPAGVGSVTSIALTGNSIFDFSGSSANPITTSGTFNLDFVTQTANKVFASATSGGAAIPAFRKLVAADLSLAAAPPANGVQYNDGTNAFTASNGFKFDPASNTVQAGESTVLKGTFQLFAALSAGSVKHTVNNPGGNYVFIWGDSLPANNDLLKVTVSGSNVTIASIAASALGFPTINATDGVIPYRSSSSAFSDSPAIRLSSVSMAMGFNAGATTGVIYTNYDSTRTKGVFEVDNTSNGQIRVKADGANGQVLTITPRNSVTGDPSIVPGGSQIDIPTILRSVLSINFGTALNTNIDVGLTRRQAGYVRASNGSTGIGGLLVGNSTATPIGQTHLINGAIGVEPLYIEAIASTSVPSIRGVISSIQSFAFNPSGKLQGGCNIPTSNQQFSARGNLKSDVSEVGNVGAGATNALSFSVPASSIVNTGDTVQFATTVVYAANANNKQVECKFGGVSVFLISDLYSGSQGEIRVRIKRTGATTAKAIATYVASDVLLQADCQYNEIAVTWSSSNTFQVILTATSNNDIINKELESNVIIAQTS